MDNLQCKFIPYFEIASNPKIPLQDIKEAIKKGDFSNVRIIKDDGTVEIFVDNVTKLRKLVDKITCDNLLNQYDLRYNGVTVRPL